LAGRHASRDVALYLPALKKGVAEQLNAGPTKEEIRMLVRQVVTDDLQTVIGTSADTTLTGIADQLTHLNDLLTAPPTTPTATGTETTPTATGMGTTPPADGSG
jgi:hypothetical protein